MYNSLFYQFSHLFYCLVHVTPLACLPMYVYGRSLAVLIKPAREIKEHRRVLLKSLYHTSFSKISRRCLNINQTNDGSVIILSSLNPSFFFWRAGGSWGNPFAKHEGDTLLKLITNVCWDLGTGCLSYSILKFCYMLILPTSSYQSFLFLKFPYFWVLVLKRFQEKALIKMTKGPKFLNPFLITFLTLQ